MTPGRFDVAVVGAGPAGSAAAIELARGGARVVLIDKSTFPRDKCCGDGLTTGALRRLEHLGFDPNEVASFTVVDELAVRSPTGRVASIPLGDQSGVPAAVATRRDLDASLVQLARRAGATTRLGSGLAALEGSSEAAVLHLEGGERLEADRVIAADGAWSSVRKLLDPNPDADGRSRVRTNWTAFRTYAGDVGADARRRLHVLFAEGLLPGYVWSFPLAGGLANIGVFVKRDGSARGSGLAAAWERARRDPYLVSLLGPKARLLAPARAWPIPTRLDAGFAALGGRVLFAGDALGAADPFTGEGIAQALETGVEAARAVARSGDAGEGAQEYERALRRGFLSDHRVASALSLAFERPLAARLAVAGSGVGSAVARQVGRFLYEDYSRSEILRPRRWPTIVRGEPTPFATHRRRERDEPTYRGG